MKILIAGSNGFLGSIIKNVLQENHDVLTLSRKNADFNADLAINKVDLPKSNLLVHCFGFAHYIPKTEEEEQFFFSTNVKGTENLLASLNKTNTPESIVYISTVAVYGMNEGNNIDEGCRTNPESAYGQSKLLAERIIIQWGIDNNVNVTILRLPLIIGKNPKGNLSSMIKAIKNGYYFRFTNKKIIKSVVLANDVALLIPTLVDKNGIYNLSDGNGISNKDIEDYIAHNYNTKIKFIPFFIVKFLAKIGDNIKFIPINSYRLEKLTNSLTFSSEKAKQELKWSPNNIFDCKWL